MLDIEIISYHVRLTTLELAAILNIFQTFCVPIQLQMLFIHDACAFHFLYDLLFFPHCQLEFTVPINSQFMLEICKFLTFNSLQYLSNRVFPIQERLHCCLECYELSYYVQNFSNGFKRWVLQLSVDLISASYNSTDHT